MALSSRNPKEIKVVESTDRLPSFWHDNAVFVANLLGLFFENEEQTKMLAEEVGEMDSYGGRLLPIIDLLYAGSEKNLLVLEREPDPYLSRYFSETVGLTLPEVMTLPHREYLELGRHLGGDEDWDSELFMTLKKHPAERLDGYVTDTTLEGMGDRLGMGTISSSQGSREGNNKWLLHQYLEEIGLPTPTTEIANNSNDMSACLDKLQRAGYQSAVIKAPMGASGIGLIKVNSLRDRASIEASVPDHFFTEGPCLVQGWIQPGEFGVTSIRSPSVQLFLNDEGVVVFDITEQILSHDSVHEGNESPPPYLADHPHWRSELITQAAEAGKWLHSRGYRGTASADLLLVEDVDGGFTIYVCELNARVTGATYPSVLAKRFLPDGAWLLRNLRFTEPVSGEELMKSLRTAHDLFVPGQSTSGVMPVNFNTGSDGLVHKGQFLCLAPSSGGSKMLLEMAKLDMPCRPDRD